MNSVRTLAILYFSQFTPLKFHGESFDATNIFESGNFEIVTFHGKTTYVAILIKNWIRYSSSFENETILLISCSFGPWNKHKKRSELCVSTFWNAYLNMQKAAWEFSDYGLALKCEDYCTSLYYQCLSGIKLNDIMPFNFLRWTEVFFAEDVYHFHKKIVQMKTVLQSVIVQIMTVSIVSY